MLAKAIIRAIMDSKGIGMVKMAEMLGFGYPMKVTNRLETVKSRNISTDKLDEMVRVLGYKVIVVPEEVQMKDGWYEVDDSRVVGAPVSGGEESNAENGDIKIPKKTKKEGNGE